MVLKTVIDPPRGRPAGGGDTYHNRGNGGFNPCYSVPENPVFTGKPLFNDEITPLRESCPCRRLNRARDGPVRRY